VPKDAAKAVYRYGKAAKQGNAMAQHNPGGVYYRGQGVPKDFVPAHMWSNLASAKEQKKVGKAGICWKASCSEPVSNAQTRWRKNAWRQVTGSADGRSLQAGLPAVIRRSRNRMTHIRERLPPSGLFNEVTS